MCLINRCYFHTLFKTHCAQKPVGPKKLSNGSLTEIMARLCCDVIGELTLIQRQSENGMVMTMSRIDKAVNAHAVNPGPSGSSEIKDNDTSFLANPFHIIRIETSL